jgi:hypothetical protein
MRTDEIVKLAKEYLKQDKLKEMPKAFFDKSNIIPVSYVLTEFYLYVEKYESDRLKQAGVKR